MISAFEQIARLHKLTETLKDEIESIKKSHAQQLEIYIEYNKIDVKLIKKLNNQIKDLKNEQK